MSALLTIMAALQGAATAPAPVVLALPPADWSAMPELTFRRRPPAVAGLSAYVRDEVRDGRCAAEGQALRVDLAVHVAGNGQIRRIRPRAINCPTVEQYASGLMLRMARSNVPPPGEDRWYRATLVFTWR